MARITTIIIAATFFKVHPRTIESWLGRGLITGYQSQHDILVSIDDIEAALKANPKRMRDGRRSRYGAAARIVPLAEAEAVD